MERAMGICGIMEPVDSCRVVNLVNAVAATAASLDTVYVHICSILSAALRLKVYCAQFRRARECTHSNEE